MTQNVTFCGHEIILADVAFTARGWEREVNAMQRPEKYQNLIVSVGGFAERSVNLPPETQREILARTLY